MSYPVFLIASISVKKDHHAIFVETDADGADYKFHVVGSIATGMQYGHRRTQKPELSATFLSRTHLGTVSVANYALIKSVVEKVPAPPKQFNGPRRINPSVPLRRCQEWTADAIQALKDEGILEA